MLKKYKWHIYIGLMILCFLVGVQIWKVAHPGQSTLKITGSSNKYRPVLAYVAGKPITSEELDWELAMHANGSVDPGIKVQTLNKNIEASVPSLKEKLLASIIEREVLYRMILRDKSFDTSDSARYSACIQEWQQTLQDLADDIDKTAEQRFKDRFCKKSLILQYLDEKIYPAITISDDEIEDFIKNNPKVLDRAEQVIIRQIVTASEKESRLAERGLTRSNFAERAKETSITPEAENGGKLGPFAKGEMPHFFNVAFQMRRGQIQGMIKSDYGFHIFLLEEKIPRKKLSLKEAIPVAKEYIYKKKKDEAYSHWMDSALNVVPIETVKSSD